MKKQFALLCLCLALALLTACEKDDKIFWGAQGLEEINLPVYSDFELCKTFTIDEENILLGYFKHDSTPGLTRDEAAATKIVLFNMADETYTEVYDGELSVNWFFDISYDFIEDGLNIYRKKYSPMFLRYDPAANSVEKIPLLYDGYLAVNLSDEAYIAFNNGILTLYKGNQQQAYDLNSEIIDYALNTEKMLFAAIDIDNKISLLDWRSGNIRSITVSENPQVLVGYSRIAWLPDNNLALSAICEDSDVCQVIDSAAGDNLAQYRAPQCQLTDTYQSNILLIERARGGEANKVIAWNYEKDTADAVFRVAEDYAGVYIYSAAFCCDHDKILIALNDNGKSRLFISDFAAPN